MMVQKKTRPNKTNTYLDPDDEYKNLRADNLEEYKRHKEQLKYEAGLDW
jgi:hypothetical protein